MNIFDLFIQIKHDDQEDQENQNLTVTNLLIADL